MGFSRWNTHVSCTLRKLGFKPLHWAVLPFDTDEYNRWFGQAKHTLRSAQRDTAESDFDWACKAQQAGEYALKALLRGFGKPAYGHSLTRLLGQLGDAGLEVAEIAGAGQLLDRHYIPTRYPDAYAEGSPHEYYDDRTAREAQDAAAQIISWVEGAYQSA